MGLLRRLQLLKELRELVVEGWDERFPGSEDQLNRVLEIINDLEVGKSEFRVVEMDEHSQRSDWNKDLEGN